ncbi:MAG: hypothetical protein EOP58_09655 [Sphingomonadales bacterium]|nr:MAG: hypothetical protein EOP58_09655 [Sphingomonadales bacterium]
MDRDDDSTFFIRRAHQERERAEAASDPAIASVHRTLAAEYERRIQGLHRDLGRLPELLQH